MDYEALCERGRRIAGDADAGRELVHDLYVRHGAAVFLWDAPYAYVALRNLYRDGLDRARYRAHDAILDYREPAREDVERTAIARAVVGELAGTTGGRCVLAVAAGYTRYEVAPALGIAPGTVGSRCSRERARLREAWA